MHTYMHIYIYIYIYIYAALFIYYLFISNFSVISYLNWVLLYLNVMDFILLLFSNIIYILRALMVVFGEQNAFLAPQPGSSLAKFVSSSLKLC